MEEIGQSRVAVGFALVCCLLPFSDHISGPGRPMIGPVFLNVQTLFITK